jgi:hypothetical protein
MYYGGLPLLYMKLASESPPWIWEALTSFIVFVDREHAPMMPLLA